MGKGIKDNGSYVLLSDVGSTTTKVLLIDVGDNARFVADAEIPTTVEKPDEDVCIGLIAACRALEKKTDIPIVGDDGDIMLPYFTTSSAGGGLQMLVIGLTIADTARSAKKATLGAGGVILKTITVDDGLHPVERMRLITELHPDMILMAGGIDGGNVASVVMLAETLSLSNPVPKFISTAKIPLVFCGNKDAREFVTKILGDMFEMSVIENIRPTLGEENIGPAKEKIHELFMENVMERAPGYDELKKWVAADIIPTPAGVENIVGLYTDSSGEKALVVDMGGATTDIFTNAGGEFRRTVAANVGMSYSVSNILAEAGAENVMKHLPVDYSEEEVRNYTANKTLNPTYVPEHKWEKAVERAAAIEGLRLAWGQHKRLHFKKELRTFLGIRGFGVYSADFALVGGVKRAESFKVSDIDLVIGAGGVLSHTDTKNEALWMLAEGFLPEGITKLAVDRSFKSPHLGVLAGHDPATALELFSGKCLEDIGYIIAPVGAIKRWRNALTVVVKRNGSEKVHRLKGGDFLFLENGGDMEITTAPFVTLENAKGPHGVTVGRRTQLKTDLPVLFDCRGRGEEMIMGALADSGISAFSSVCESIGSTVREITPDIYEGEYQIERRLPYEGEILVGVGDRVEPDTVVGRNRYGPPRIYILDINRRFGYGKAFSEAEIAEGLLVNIGDPVSIDRNIFKARVGALGALTYFKSPVRGIVTKIDKGGLVILREIQDYTGEPVTVNVAEQLSIKPKKMSGYLKFREGDFIESGRSIVEDVKRSLFVRSPETGTVKEINTEKGTVTIQYDLNPVTLKAFVGGTVSNIEENVAAEITGTGATLHGAVGFGGENVGNILVYDKPKSLKGSDAGKVIVTSEPVDEAFLKLAAELRVAGVVAPSINSGDWVRFCGREMGVAVTGDEPVPFTLILTEGFGRTPMNDTYREFLKDKEGKIASLSGKTQIRAGVIRPKVIVVD
jgi:uncharacterized protein (TIGR01319 family)